MYLLTYLFIYLFSGLGYSHNQNQLIDHHSLHLSMKMPVYRTGTSTLFFDMFVGPYLLEVFT